MESIFQHNISSLSELYRAYIVYSSLQCCTKPTTINMDWREDCFCERKFDLRNLRTQAGHTSSKLLMFTTKDK